MLKNIIIVIVLLLISVVSTITYKLDKTMNTPLAIENNTFITIKSGSSISNFVKQLATNKWIEDTFLLKGYARVFPKKVNIKAGTYLVPKETTLSMLLVQLVEGKEHQFSITFIEGTKFTDVLSILSQHPHIKHTINDKTVQEVAVIVGIEAINPEGWLFPDTYAFTAGTLDISLLQRAHLNMKNQLNNLWESRAVNLPYQSAYEALIMASIIEKETSYVAEQPMISSVFVNRLRKGMRLQTDPTIIYGLGDRYKGDITYAHKREKTAYNTYRIDGLPPTPIAMAGLSALKATLNPATSEYYYFVSGGYGKHVFSRTLKEHNKAVQEYLAIQRKKFDTK